MPKNLSQNKHVTTMDETNVGMGGGGNLGEVASMDKI